MKYLYMIVSLFMGFSVLAQNKIPIQSQDYANTGVQMADAFRSEGKIYVVLGVVLIILLGFLLYLFVIDRKIEHLKKIINQEQK